MERLYRVAREIHSTLEPREALRLVVREAVRLVNATSGSIVMVNPTTGLLDIEAAEGLPEDGTLRCDLHPRWNRDGRQVCIDSIHEGNRHMYVLDVPRIVER